MAPEALNLIQTFMMSGQNKVQKLLIFCNQVQHSQYLKEAFGDFILTITNQFHVLTIEINKAIREE